MQIQTTTVTTETAKAEGVIFKVTTYEMKITAFCDCCPNQATGTRQTLENAGWELNADCQFCPECNF